MDNYTSQFQDQNGDWRRRDPEGKITPGSRSTPYPKIPKEKPGKGNG